MLTTSACKRQKDPYAVTAGLSYTPVPLVSFSAEQRQGSSGKHDTRFGLALTYTPGVSLSAQLDPEAVAVRRSLAGSRHDLVARNNNMVLEYRKKALVRLRLSDPVTGYPGEEKPLVASLQTKYALKSLTAESPALVEAGGGLRAEGQQVQVTLPAYRYTASAEADNSYAVTVMAEDVKGNRSSRETATVLVRAPALDPDTSTVETDRDVLPADGQGNAVSGLEVKATFTAPEGLAIELEDAFTETQTKGTYTATLRGSSPGEVKVMPQVGGKDAAQAGVTVTAGAVDPGKSSVATDSSTYTAGKTMTLKVTLKDANNNLVPGLTGKLAEAVTVPGAAAGEAGWAEDQPGEYTATYTAETAGDGLKATLKLGGWATARESEAYTIITLAPVPMAGSITANGKADFSTTASTKFPTTGFKGAYFTLNADNFSAGKNVSDYTLKAVCGGNADSCDWVSVDSSGKVTFSGDAASASKAVTLTAVPKAGTGVYTPLTYTFTINSWFLGRSSFFSWGSAATWCSTQGLSQPDRAALTQGTNIRAVGSLWSEWGSMDNYSGSSVKNHIYWTSEAVDSIDGYHYTVNLTDGLTSRYIDRVGHVSALCRYF